MALTLTLTNFSKNNIIETAQVAIDAVSGQPILTLDNSQAFSVNDYVLVGRIGGSQSKIYQVLSVSGENVTFTSNLEFYTERGTDVTKIFGNKLKVYSAPYVVGTMPVDASFSLVNNGTVTIDADQLTTSFTDVNGSDQFWYKYTFYNSLTQGETTLSSSTAVRDTSATNYASIDDIRREAGFTGNSGVTDDLLNRKLQAAQSKINGMLSGRYVLPLGQPINPIIADLTVRLAAGYAMIAEYGTFDGADKSKGEKLRDDALAELKDYQSGSQVITDLQAISTVITDSGGFGSGYTNDTTVNPLGFSRLDTEGYGTRNY